MSEKLEHCTVHVSADGRAVAHYRWDSADVDGRDAFDEDVRGWSDDEIRDMAADLIGADDPANKEKIVIEWE